MDLIENINQKLKYIQTYYPLEYSNLLNKYKFITWKEPADITFIIQYRNLSRVVIQKHIVFEGDTYYVKDWLENFRYPIFECNDVYKFSVPLEEIDSSIRLMMEILDELKLCEISKLTNKILFVFKTDSKLIF